MNRNWIHCTVGINGWLVTIALCLGCGQAEQDTQNVPRQQEELLDFQQVEYIWGQDPSRFSRLWARADAETVRIAVLGDSQETSPERWGDVYIPRLNYEAWRRYGNVPETPVAWYGSYGDGSPWGEWLLSGGAAAPGASPTRIASDRLLPGSPAASHSSNLADRNINGQRYGQLAVLQQDARSVAPGAEISSNTDYFCTGSPVRAQVFAATHPESGEVRYMARPTDSTVVDYAAPISIEGLLDMGLTSSVYAVKSAITPPLPFAGRRYLQLELLGNLDAKLTDIVGLRFVSQACSHGMVFQSLAASGYTTDDVLSKHGDAGVLFKALGFHAAVLHLGVNDAGSGLTAEEYRSKTEKLIAMLRTWTKDPSFLIVLMSDPYRTRWGITTQREFDRYVGVHFAIAQQDPNVLMVNSRRLMHDIGWNETRPDRLSLFLADEVHYSPRGAMELAAAEIATLLGR